MVREDRGGIGKGKCVFGMLGMFIVREGSYGRGKGKCVFGILGMFLIFYGIFFNKI